MKTHWIALIVAIGLSPFAIAQRPSASATQFDFAGSAWVGETTSQSAQAPGAASGGSTVALPVGATIPAELAKSVDVKKVKVGDEVTAKVTQDVLSNGNLIVRRGSRIVGHITETQVRTKENAESRLGMVFDHIVLKDGSQIAFNSILQALAAAPQASMPSPDLGPPGGSMGANRQQPMGTPGAMGAPQPSSMPSTVGTQNYPSGSGGSSNSSGNAGAGTLSSASQGVIGLKGLTLNPEASGNAPGSVITSDRENVKLDSGTQMILRATAPAPQ